MMFDGISSSCYLFITFGVINSLTGSGKPAIQNNLGHE